jgi:seryl-tRNA synthetase
MLDIKWIRDNPQHLDKALENRGKTPCSQIILDLDTRRRTLQTQLQEVQSQRNDLAKAIGQAKAQKNEEEAERLSVSANALKEQVSTLEQQERDVSNQLDEYLVTLPNIPRDDVPVGKSSDDNQLVHTWGTPTHFDFAPQSHYELGENLGLMSFELAAKLSGARFVVLRGDLARLERAVAQFMLDTHTQVFGYEEVSPPLLVKDEAFFGAGLLPKFADNAFQTTTGHWLIPTAEVSLTNLVREEILEPHQLPLRFVAHTPCFRSEAGAAGKDTRGMIRQHQFYKVELVSIVHPDDLAQEHERMTTCAETILQKLKQTLARVILIWVLCNYGLFRMRCIRAVLQILAPQAQLEQPLQ